jgi:hypothetical protein
MITMGDSLRFVPKRVEGLSDVTEVAVFGDRVELLGCKGGCRHIRRDRRPRRLVFSLDQLHHGLPCVGDRDWFYAPEDRFIIFYTTPRLVAYFPDEVGVEYDTTCFRQLQKIITQGGFTLRLNEPRGSQGSNKVVG